MAASPRSPPIEERLMIEPPCSRIHDRQASCDQTNAPRTFTWKVLSQAASSASMVAPITGFVAALFTSTSSAPNRSRVAATQDAAWSGSPAFAAKVPTRAPGTVFSIATAASSRPGCLRDVSITAAPPSASEVAIARPMPFDDPVTIATRPSSSCATSGSLARDDGRMSGVAVPDRVATPPSQHAPRLGYIPALDGLRAVAVVAVLLYHADQRWIPGGFLGVDVFFVISGYLITCLLLADWQQHGHIQMARFWIRRARRLLPA